ncbi:MAG TPA: hypothetical protein PKV27_12510 [Ilumatobacteraceae bacterium]|nr:hypothetical protein [Ilumatobacteraceae bacterium]
MTNPDDIVIDTWHKPLWTLIEERAAATPDKRLAYDEAGRTMTYGEYHHACLRAAAGFHAMGIGEGSRVS